MKLNRLFRNFIEIHEVFLYSKQPKPKRKLKSLVKLDHTRFEPSVGNFEFDYICSINNPIFFYLHKTMQFGHYESVFRCNKKCCTFLERRTFSYK